MQTASRTQEESDLRWRLLRVKVTFSITCGIGRTSILPGFWRNAGETRIYLPKIPLWDDHSFQITKYMVLQLVAGLFVLFVFRGLWPAGLRRVVRRRAPGGTSGKRSRFTSVTTSSARRSACPITITKTHGHEHDGHGHTETDHQEVTCGRSSCRPVFALCVDLFLLCLDLQSARSVSLVGFPDRRDQRDRCFGRGHSAAR